MSASLYRCRLFALLPFYFSVQNGCHYCIILFDATKMLFFVISLYIFSWYNISLIVFFSERGICLILQYAHISSASIFFPALIFNVLSSTPWSSVKSIYTVVAVSLICACFFFILLNVHLDISVLLFFFSCGISHCLLSCFPGVWSVSLVLACLPFIFVFTDAF